jgi:hypothetical protein
MPCHDSYDDFSRCNIRILSCFKLCLQVTHFLLPTCTIWKDTEHMEGGQEMFMNKLFVTLRHSRPIGIPLFLALLRIL